MARKSTIRKRGSSKGSKERVASSALTFGSPVASDATRFSASHSPDARLLSSENTYAQPATIATSVSMFAERWRAPRIAERKNDAPHQTITGVQRTSLMTLAQRSSADQ